MNIYQSNLFATAAQQGAGLVDTYQALTSTTMISPSELSLNDTMRKAASYKIKVFNIGDQVAVYNVSHVGAALATGKAADDDQLFRTPLYSADYAVSFVLQIYITLEDFLQKRGKVSFSVIVNNVRSEIPSMVTGTPKFRYHRMSFRLCRLRPFDIELVVNADNYHCIFMEFLPYT